MSKLKRLSRSFKRERKNQLEEALKKKFQKSYTIFLEALKNYPNIAVAFSGGKDSLINVILSTIVDHPVKIFSVLTPYKFKETWEYIVMLKKMYNLNLEIFMAYDKKPNILYDSEIAFTPYPDIWEEFQMENDIKDSIIGDQLCCDLLKKKVAQRAIRDQNLDAFFSGLRHDEADCRKEVPVIQNIHGVKAINTILDWNIKDVFAFAEQRGFPINPLYEKGYLSLGCEPCTCVPPYGGSERDGRCFKDNRSVCQAFDSK